jgi:hypothetical protein
MRTAAVKTRDVAVAVLYLHITRYHYYYHEVGGGYGIIVDTKA